MFGSGVELGPNIIQTFQASFAHNFYIPRFITPFKIGSGKKRNCAQNSY